MIINMLWRLSVAECADWRMEERIYFMTEAKPAWPTKLLMADDTPASILVWPTLLVTEANPVPLRVWRITLLEIEANPAPILEWGMNLLVTEALHGQRIYRGTILCVGAWACRCLSCSWRHCTPKKPTFKFAIIIQTSKVRDCWYNKIIEWNWIEAGNFCEGSY